MSSTGRVPLLDENDRFPDRFAPPSVAADAVAAEVAREGSVAAASDATAAKTGAETARDKADAAAVRAEAVPAQVDTAMAGQVGTGGEFDTKLNATFASVSQLIVDASTPTETIQSWLNASTPLGVKKLVGSTSITSTLFAPSGLYLDATAATLLCATPGNSDELFGIVGVSDVTIIGGVWDGGRSTFPGDTEWRHVINIVGSTNVYLNDLITQNAKGDGVYVGDDATPCENINLRGVLSRGNARNAIAIVAVRRFRAENCRFTDSGFGDGAKHPRAGLDIEPNLASTVVDDIVFTDCDFSGNAQYGLMVSLPNVPGVRQGGITFANCGITGNGIGSVSANGLQAVRLHGAQDVTFLGSLIADNAAEGVRFTGNTGKRITFSGTEIARNGLEGIRVTGIVDRLVLDRVIALDNGQAGSPGTYDGINIEYGTGIVLSEVVSTGPQQRYGLRTLASVSGVTITGGSYAGNGTATQSLSDNVGSRLTVTREGVSVPGATATVPTFETRISGDAYARTYIRADGSIYMGSGAATPDVRLYRAAADTLRTNDAFIVDQELNPANRVRMTATDGTGYVEMREQASAPSVPSADMGRFFFRDDGSGKTQFCVQFNTGGVQVIATQP